MADWEPVTGASGEVLGWMSAADPDEPGDYFEADRRPKVARRAAAIGEVADLAASPAFDLDEVCASGEARIGEDGVDAALGVALELQQVEMLRW
jgi:hypothetical protein